jgi:hypothetical protein
MKQAGIEAEMMQGVALTLLVKSVMESLDGRIRLTEADFALVDTLSPEDKWTVELNEETGELLIGLMRKEKIS